LLSPITAICSDKRILQLCEKKEYSCSRQYCSFAKQLKNDELSEIQKEEIQKNIETEQRKLFKPIIDVKHM
jgi:spore coat protein CotF